MMAELASPRATAGMMACWKNVVYGGRGRKPRMYGGFAPQPVGGSHWRATPKIHTRMGPSTMTGTETPKIATLMAR